MNSRKVEQISEVNVKAYRYHFYYFTGKSFWPTVAYWVPDYNIVFTSHACSKSAEPYNNANCEATGNFGTLTSTIISKSLAENLAAIANTKAKEFQKLSEAVSPVGPGYSAITFNNISCYIEDELRPEFNKLLSQTGKVYEVNGNLHTERELSFKHEFDRAFNAIGNDALKDAFKDYILNSELPDNIYLDDLFERYNKLEEREKDSIVASLQFELLDKHDIPFGYRRKPNLATIDDTSTLPKMASANLEFVCKTFTAATTVVSLRDTNPLVGLGGLALSSMTFFGAKAYDSYRAPAFIAVRHQRSDEIFSNLAKQQTIHHTI